MNLEEMAVAEAHHISWDRADRMADDRAVGHDGVVLGLFSPLGSTPRRPFRL